MRRGVGRERERSVGRSVPTISRVTNRENGPTGILRASRTFQCAWCDRCTGKVQTRSGLSHFFADRDRGGSATLENRACASATRSFHRQTDSQTVELASLGGWSTLAYEDSKLYGECRSPVNEGGGEERKKERKKKQTTFKSILVCRAFYTCRDFARDYRYLFCIFSFSLFQSSSTLGETKSREVK